MQTSLKYMLLLLLVFCLPKAKAQTVDLSGRWEFQIDRNETLSATSAYDDHIVLPGSMPERLKGDRPNVHTQWTGALYDSSYFYNPYMERYRREENFKVPFFLTPDRHYIGRAWYRRVIDVPRDMANKRLTLYLERPHITTTLYVNGREVGTQNSLSVAQEWDVTAFVKAGKTNTIALCIDNDINKVGVGGDSHSVTDQTQGNWNGVVGQMKLVATPKVYIQNIKVFTDADHRTAQARILVRNTAGKGVAGTPLQLSLDGSRQIGGSLSARVPQDTATYTIDITGLGDAAMLWDEFNPYVYTLNASLTSKAGQQRETTQFGIRKIEARGKMIYVNGREVMLRGTVENCDFPNTGYAPTDEASWERVFRICKSYGLNHMRFHSFCPPEAAFNAADRLGFYLQPEGPSWPNHGVKLGVGQQIDKYLMEETQRMVERYGNHPSFCMMACGNEPAGNWVKWVSQFVDYWKAADPRRIYTGASVGGSWAWQPRNQYHVKAGARGLGEWARSQPESVLDFSSKIDTVSQPFVSHETGQWCAFPDLDETDQYVGVNKAKNFEIFRDLMNDHHMGNMTHRFMMASGKLQSICYKFEMERILRTPNYAGFQLLGLNDYSGQGSAIVGLLNVFFREKGYVDAKEFTEACAPITVMARLPKFTYWNDEQVALDIDVSNYGDNDGTAARMIVSLKDDNGQGKTSLIDCKRLERGLQKSFVHWSAQSFETVSKATHYTLELTLEDANTNTLAQNHYDLWVYPRTSAVEAKGAPDDIYVCNTLDDKAREVLRTGGKVLVEAAGRVTYGKDIVQQFLPVFWNTSWFKMRPPHTVGLYIQSEHPIFRNFPTDYYSNLQWWELVNRQQVMQFDEFPHEFQPIVQSIDTWFLSRKIGMLYEARVGEGRLVMTTMPLGGDAKSDKPYDKHPVQAQMRKAILDYMQSEDFKPAFSLEADVIDHLFTKEAPKVNMFTKDSPDELKKGVR